MEAPPKAKGRGQSESRTRETSTGPEEASPDHRSLRGRRRHEHFGHMGDLLGAIQIWNGSRSRASTSSATPPHTEFKESDAVERRQLDPSIAQAPASSRPPHPGRSGRAITRLPAHARFAPRPLLLDLADQVSTYLREGMVKVALVGGGHEVRPSP